MSLSYFGPRLVCWLLIVAPVLLGLAPANAQLSQEDFRSVFATLQNLRRKEPEKVPVEAKRFLAEKKFSDRQSAQIYSLWADTQNKVLKLPQVALQTIEEGLSKPRDVYTKIQLLDVKLNILTDLSRTAEIETLIVENWNEVSQTGQFLGWLNLYVNLLDQSNRKEQGTQFLEQNIVERMARLDGSPSLFRQLAVRYRDAGQREKALEWAALSFVLVPYAEGHLKQAARLVVEMATPGPVNEAAMEQHLLKLQVEPTSSLLKGVKRPVMDAGKLRQQFGQGLIPAQEITLHLCLGEERAAMIKARRQMLLRPQSPDGVLLVCRVLKARDRSLKSATEFLEYRRTGNGYNPLPEFMKATQAQAPGGGAQ